MNRVKAIRAPLFAAFLVALACSAPSLAQKDPGKDYDPPGSYPEAIDQVERPSDFFAAFIAAYQADRKWFKEQEGVDLTPAEFSRRRDRVLVSRLSDGRFEVQMGPEAITEGPQKSIRVVNPGRRYVIDPKSFAVLEGFFDR